MFKPPFAAAATAILITLAGGPFGLGEAHARAIYTGTFDPRGDVYGFEGTHQFSVDEACLTTAGWHSANDFNGYGYDGDGNYNYYNSCGAVVLTGGSLTLRKYASAETNSAGAYVDNTLALDSSGAPMERTFDFSEASPDWTPGYGMSQYIVGLYVAYNPLTGRNELAGVDTPALFGSFGAFDGYHWALEWVSANKPTGFQVDGGEGFFGVDPVFLHQSECAGFDCPFALAEVPGAVPTFTRVPEPGALALAGLALAAMAGVTGVTRRRRAAR
jgi:hypothetical protein